MFSSLDQVTNKVLLALINELQLPFRIRNRSGKYLVYTSICNEKKRQEAVAFGEPVHSSVICFQLVDNKGSVSLKTLEEGKEKTKPKLVVFNQAEAPNVLLREKPCQGDFVLKLVQNSKLSWYFANSRENIFVACKRNENFYFTEEVAHAEELFLEIAAHPLLKKLESLMDTTLISVEDRKQVLSELESGKHPFSGKFLCPTLSVFYSIISFGARFRFQSHHNTWLKVDWYSDPPILSTTSNKKQDPCTQFQIVGFGTTALICQRESFMNIFSYKCVRFMKEPCFFGLEYDISCKRVAIFVPFSEEELYLCVTKKQNIELHRKKRAWELFQVFINEEDIDRIISSCKSNTTKQPLANISQQSNKDESNKEFSYSKAIGNEDTKSVSNEKKKNSNGSSSNAGTTNTCLEPQPRKKKNKRRKNKQFVSQSSFTNESLSRSNQQGKIPSNNSENTKASVDDDTNVEKSNVQQASQPTSQSSKVSNQVCASCHQPIMSNYATAMGKSFHTECLRCFHCGTVLVTCGDGNFRRENGKPYCNTCYAQYVAPRCAKCLQPILGTVTKAMKQNWHPQCLICTQCNTPLSTTFYLFPELPRHPVCSRCAVGIEQNELRRRQMRKQSHVLPTSLRLGTLHPFSSS